MKYLRRDPVESNDVDGWQFWTNRLNSSGDYGNIIDSFQLSIEYRNRLGFN